MKAVKPGQRLSRCPAVPTPGAPRRRAATVLVGALLAGLLHPAPASAERTVKISGGGWGHGIGMSQYGAYGRAKNGRSAEEILEHYYSGAQVSTADMPPNIRVGLLQGRTQTSVSSTPFGGGSGEVVFKVEGKKGAIARGGPDVTWRVEPSPTGGMRLYRDGEQVKVDGTGVFGDPARGLILKYQKLGSLVRVIEKSNNYAYGSMEFGTYSSSSCDEFCLRLVLSLSMQKYLYGLGEVPSSWPGAALRTQAIAGRTYAYEKVQRSGQHRIGCDCAVYDSVVDQAYIGDAKRTGSGEYWDDWKAAVDDTKDQVALYNATPIQALYSSSSGGHTEHNENVWGGTPLPYLRGVKDTADAVDANPNHTWELSMSWQAFEQKLDNAYGIGELEEFKLIRPFGVSGRVTVVKPDNTGGVKIVGSKKTERVSGWSVRSALGLKDTLFRVEIVYSVGANFVDAYRRLDGAPGDALAASYPVPIGWDKPLGRAQRFEKGRMMWRKETDKTVWQHGPILRKYDRLGREKSGLGMPSSSIWGPGRYLGATYVGGVILWSEDTGARHVRGDFLAAYRDKRGPKGPLGLPLAAPERRDSLPHKGRRQRFQLGMIYRNPNLDEAFALWGAIATRYRKMGEARSACGYPTAHMVSEGDEAAAQFANGAITWTEAGGVTVSCS